MNTDSDFILEDSGFRMQEDKKQLNSPGVSVHETHVNESPNVPLIRALQNDLDWAWSYHCNIAMAFQDEGGDHKTANRAAARFMKNWADVDTTQHVGYKAFNYEN